MSGGSQLTTLPDSVSEGVAEFVCAASKVKHNEPIFVLIIDFDMRHCFVIVYYSTIMEKIRAVKLSSKQSMDIFMHVTDHGDVESLNDGNFAITDFGVWEHQGCSDTSLLDSSLVCCFVHHVDFFVLFDIVFTLLLFFWCLYSSTTT